MSMWCTVFNYPSLCDAWPFNAVRRYTCSYLH